ncbi:MAG: serine hydrolase, partial [Acidobacteriota bacterium]
TPYRIASITKTFSSMLLMRCVERNSLNLDTLLRSFTPALESGVTVRHLMTHTSQGTPPGEKFIYSGDRYNYLTPVVEACAGRSFREELAKTILDQLEMRDSVPGQDMEFPSPQVAALFTPETLQRYVDVIHRLAKPYVIGSNGQPILSVYPNRNIFAAAGLISTVRDLARYDAAIDRHALLQQPSQEQAWTNHVNSKGQRLPHALGWFVQMYGGQRLIWHYGYWNTFSALFLKVPGRNITLILLANSDGLSAPFGNALGGAGDVTGSPFANLFLQMLSDPAAFPPPGATSIVSAASYEPEAVAPGSMAIAYGNGLATVTSDASSPELPTSLGGTSLYINGSAAPLYFVSPQQIAFLVPPSARTGHTIIDIFAADGSWSRGELIINTTSPGLFSVNGQGSFAPVAEVTADGLRYRPVSNQDGTLNLVNSGDRLVLYATGIRGDAESVTVSISGITAVVVYAGPQRGLAGLDQIDAIIPAGVNGLVDVIVSIKGRLSNTVQINVR